MNVRMVDAALEAHARRGRAWRWSSTRRCKPGAGDRFLLDAGRRTSKAPVILVLNKVDLVDEAEAAAAASSSTAARDPFAEIVPVSAVDGTTSTCSSGCCCSTCPRASRSIPTDYLTDQPERFFVAEIVREQVLQLTHDELPFSTAVIVDSSRSRTTTA